MTFPLLKKILLPLVGATAVAGCSATPPLQISSPPTTPTNAVTAASANFTLEEASQVAEAIQAEHAGLSNAEFQRLFAERLQTGAYKIQGSAVGDGYNNLNPMEKRLIKNEPWNAPKTLYAKNDATRRAIALFGDQSDADSTKQNAFKHAYWNVLMSKYLNVDWASRFATAHEIGTPDNPAAEMTMDLQNNMVGRTVFNNNQDSNWLWPWVKVPKSSQAYESILLGMSYRYFAKDKYLDITQVGSGALVYMIK